MAIFPSVRSRVSLAGVAVALAVAGCGSAQPKNAAPSQQSVNTAFRGSPAPLASLHNQANQLLGGGTSAFDARLASLRGYPVVVNKWASWCGPCQTEFPVFQRASVALGRKVAFMGIDGKDQHPAAKSFLHKFPVTYPSYVDPHETIARKIHAATYYPQTIYYDRNGKIVFDHAGPYESVSALEKDIRQYGLG
jgi:cytochrome c biogenesis protein CcmG/thiol:disulfide interchange protein DsbE